jgi:hypothetical protein
MGFCRALQEFCLETPFNDDCTVVEISFLGAAAAAVPQVVLATSA